MYRLEGRARKLQEKGNIILRLILIRVTNYEDVHSGRHGNLAPKGRRTASGKPQLWKGPNPTLKMKTEFDCNSNMQKTYEGRKKQSEKEVKAQPRESSMRFSLRYLGV